MYQLSSRWAGRGPLLTGSLVGRVERSLELLVIAEIPWVLRLSGVFIPPYCVSNWKARPNSLMYLPILQIACFNQQSIMIRKICLCLGEPIKSQLVTVEVVQASEVHLELMYVLGQSLRRELIQWWYLKQKSVCSVQKFKLSSHDKNAFSPLGFDNA